MITLRNSSSQNAKAHDAIRLAAGAIFGLGIAKLRKMAFAEDSLAFGGDRTCGRRGALLLGGFAVGNGKSYQKLPFKTRPASDWLSRAAGTGRSAPRDRDLIAECLLR